VILWRDQVTAMEPLHTLRGSFEIENGSIFSEWNFEVDGTTLPEGDSRGSGGFPSHIKMKTKSFSSRLSQCVRVISVRVLRGCIL